MSILVINNHGQYNHRIRRTLKYLKIETEHITNDLTSEDIISKNPKGLILGGGPSLDDIGNCLDYIKDVNVPILGICLGHQIIAKAFGGNIRTAKSESYAQIELDIINEEDIFKDVGPRLSVWASHKDEVSVIPSKFNILARSNICDVEAIKHVKRPIYGIQFHPEVYHTENGEKIFENFYNICKHYP